MQSFFSYSLAAIQLHLPHQIYEPLTVTQALWLDEWNNVVEPRYSIYYCHRYILGNWEFDDAYADRLKCSDQLIPLPPTIASPPVNSENAASNTAATSWIAWTLIPMLNGAFVAYKDVICANKTAVYY